MSPPIYLRAIAHYVPDAVLANAHFEAYLDTTAAWIAERTGIRERRHLADHDGDSPGFELVRRAHAALERDPAYDRARIDLVISASSHHDLAYPNAADRLSHALGLGCPCFQLQAACSSVAYAISVARAMLLATPHMRDVLVVCGEAFTRHVDYGDRSSAVLFGDAGCALVVSREPADRGFEIVDLELGGEGSDIVAANRRSPTTHLTAHDLVARRRPAANEPPGGKFSQDGRAVVDWVMRVMPPAIAAMLGRNELAATDIDAVITHQANLRIMESLVAAAGFRPAAHRYVIDRYGNTSSAGWVIALSEARATIEPGARVLAAVFGAGMTWATLLLHAARRPA